MNDDGINKDFDDFLKKRYENHTIEPERALWDGINARLYQKKTDFNLRKVRHLKVAVASLSMVLIATFIYFEIKTQKHQPETQSAVQVDKKTVPAEISKENLSVAQYNNTQEKKSDSINNVSVFGTYLSIAGSSENKTKRIRETDNHMRENKNLPTSLKHLSDSVKNFEFSNAISKENIVDNMNSDITITSSSPLLNSDSIKNQPFTLMTTGIRDSATMVPNNAKVPEKIRIPKYIETGSLKLLEPITSVLPFIIRPNIDKSVNLQIAGSNEITQLSQKSDQRDLKLPAINQSQTKSGESGTSRTGGKPFPFFIDGFVSPEFSYRALVANTKYSIPDYGKTYFNKKEKPDFTFSTGVSLGFGITDNIILRSGIFYSRYSLKFKTEALHLTNIGTDGSYLYTSSGTVNLSFISSDSLSNESLLKSSLNFSYLNIPLIAELHFLSNYFINLGLNFNMLVGQNMNWQAENYDGNFSNANADPIDGLEPVIISAIVGFGTEKHLTRKLSMILNPSLKICLSPINHTAPVKSYPYVWGLNAGLRYYFN